MSIHHILVIDDDELIRRSTQVCLEVTRHWRVSAAGSGRVGLAIAAGDRPDVILLDLMMPDMDGLETFQQLQLNPETQPIPVLLLTAKLTDSEGSQFTQLGMAGVIIKPFDPLTIADQILTLVAQGDP